MRFPRLDGPGLARRLAPFAVLVPLAAAAEPPPVLLELFTSEGCSSCPAADSLLAAFARTGAVAGARVVVLEEHVDYWDRLGWRDPFGSPQFSARQRERAARSGERRIYTPQLVVDGVTGLVGSDAAAAHRAIARAASAPKHSLEITVNGLEITVLTPRSGFPAPAAVHLALAEDRLVSRVGAGENARRTLRHHAVARRLLQLGLVEPGGGERRFPVRLAPLDPAWKPEDLRLVAFVQETGSGRVVAVAEAGL